MYQFSFSDFSSRRAALDKPRVLVGCVVGHEVEQNHLEPPADGLCMSRSSKSASVPKRGSTIAIVGDVVAEIQSSATGKTGEIQIASTPKADKIFEPPPDPREVADVPSSLVS